CNVASGNLAERKIHFIVQTATAGNVALVGALGVAGILSGSQVGLSIVAIGVTSAVAHAVLVISHFQGGHGPLKRMVHKWID
ncbi:MAG TPA: hypothetical protein VIH61_06815, partial [Waddliaceae bacterium]